MFSTVHPRHPASDKQQKREHWVDKAETIRIILDRLCRAAQPHVFRLSWLTDISDTRTLRHYASACCLQIGSSLFGVTARHVIERYCRDKENIGKVHFCLSDHVTDLDIIDVGQHGVDIATFRVQSTLLARIGKRPLVYSIRDWPPAAPRGDTGAVIAGFPVEFQTIENDGSSSIHMISNRLLIQRIVSNNMIIRATAKHLISLDDKPVRTLSIDVGGFSGAPILVEARSPAKLLDFGGVLTEGGLFEHEDGQVLEFSAEPARRIKVDGRINYSII